MNKEEAKKLLKDIDDLLKEFEWVKEIKIEEGEIKNRNE